MRRQALRGKAIGRSDGRAALRVRWEVAMGGLGHSLHGVGNTGIPGAAVPGEAAAAAAPSGPDEPEDDQPSSKAVTSAIVPILGSAAPGEATGSQASAEDAEAGAPGDDGRVAPAGAPAGAGPRGRITRSPRVGGTVPRARASASPTRRGPAVPPHPDDAWDRGSAVHLFPPIELPAPTPAPESAVPLLAPAEAPAPALAEAAAPAPHRPGFAASRPATARTAPPVVSRVVAQRGSALPSRAERLGLAEAAPTGSAWPLPSFAFPGRPGRRRVESQLSGAPDGLGAHVFTLSADAGTPSAPAAVHRYHAAALELGFTVPWFALAARRVNQPSPAVYPGRPGIGPATGDLRTDREYTLLADDRAAVGRLLDGPLREWLPGALALRIGTRRVVALEAAAGWALAAIQADDSLEVPDRVALAQQRRLGQAGPWPDALLALLRSFRATVPRR